MFNNLINIDDLTDLFKKIRHNPHVFSKLFYRLIHTQQERTKTAWAYTYNPPQDWFAIPAVLKRWNVLISGDPDVDYRHYIAQKYLSSASSLSALSLGCGNGSNEIAWAELGIFHDIDAYDISRIRLDNAIMHAKEHEVDHIIDFQLADVYQLEKPEHSYDVVLVEGSLHHFSPLREILERIARWLKPEGYFILHEYAGPTRFQWTNRQVEVSNSLLSLLPRKYTQLYQSRQHKDKVLKPGRLRMILRDPSEAVESARIRPLIHEIFDVVELKGFGGTILHLLFYGIAHNFLADDPDTQRWLKLCFDIEDQLIAEGDLTSDFIVAVCQKRCLVAHSES